MRGRKMVRFHWIKSVSSITISDLKKKVTTWCNATFLLNILEATKNHLRVLVWQPQDRPSVHYIIPILHRIKL